MKRLIFTSLIASLLFSSCVALSKYQTLDTEHTRTTKELALAQQELQSKRNENSDLMRQNQGLTAQLAELMTTQSNQEKQISDLLREKENLQHSYDTMMENYSQRVAGSARDLAKANNLLTVRDKELSEKEAAFRVKAEEFATKEMQLKQRQDELEASEQEARKALEAKEQELEKVRSSVTNALVGFTDKGLNIETKDGKVYVSMESKLMFASASWSVSAEGTEAIKGLAKVLEENPDLNIMVEGHTDNDAYKGSTAVKDNWDLSVMRATAIVKLLLKYGPGIDPSRIEACGHAEYSPKVENDTPANKAINRRTEIILSPKISDILNILN